MRPTGCPYRTIVNDFPRRRSDRIRPNWRGTSLAKIVSSGSALVAMMGRESGSLNVTDVAELAQDG